MLKLHVLQARQGDCLILEYGTAAKPRYILIDGGPATVYEDHLRSKLLEIQASGSGLDLAIVSHVDDDHIVGVLALMTEMQQQRERGAKETIAIQELWHNTFSQTLGRDVEERFKAWRSGVSIGRGAMPFSARSARSIRQGDELTRDAGALQIPINPEFAVDHLVCLDDAPTTLGFGKLKLRILGPTRKNLKALRTQWIKWLDEQDKSMRLRGAVRAREAARMADQSVPNLSSIMVLAEYGGKTMLLTGDGRWVDLLKGLDQASLLTPDKKLHVDVLKLPHHGSQRNISKKFLNQVTADKYVVSANGMNENPDLNTLKWIVEAAKEGGRSIEIHVTNATDSTHQLVDCYDPVKYGYRLVEIKPSEHSMVV